ncbi:hypothetical protein [Arthrobacter sp. IK3]|uniref:hypothetical protein n=1 Tax=Arthrobacter sp. IK3 TaxID=3448169 RepID=UPI003EE33544
MSNRIAGTVSVIAAAVLLAGCSSAQGSDDADRPEPSEIVSSPGMDTWNAQVIKNYFFNVQSEDCSDIETSTASSDYNTFIKCENAGTYMWFFDDTEQRDAQMPEILERDLPLLVSEKWVIASGLDLEKGQAEVGGAINVP